MFTRSPLAAVIALVASLTAAPLFAATFTVNSPSDVNDATAGNGLCETAPGNGVCTLRAAIQEANALGGTDIISLPALPAPNAYVLTLAAELTISSNLTLNGGGAATTIIDGNRNVRPNSGVLVIDAEMVMVTIGGVTIRNGSQDLPSVGGGGIINFGTLTLAHSTVSGNNSPHQGGGIYNAGTLTLTNSTVSANSAVDPGGGIISFGTLTLANSTVSGNTANQGGGIYSYTTGVTTIVNSTVSSNHVGTQGGGIYSDDGTIYLFNATIANNLGNLNEQNSAGTMGAGVFHARGTVNFQNSIILGNLDSAGLLGQFPSDCIGTVTSNGNNVVGSPTLVGCTVIGGGVTFVNSFGVPYLGPLQDNGGPTRTHALLADNPALNGGNVLGCRDQFGALLSTDQRGFPRPFAGTNCDSGAFESQDPDSDGVDAFTDNCILVANPTQLDANGDGYGNLCDADLNDSGLVTSIDFNLLRTVLNQSAGSGALAAAADMNGSGTVTVLDYNLLRSALNQPPGPSGLHPDCPPTCP